MDERAYMVMGVDDLGDAHLYATENRERAEAMLAEFREDLSEVRANWLEWPDEAEG